MEAVFTHYMVVFRFHMCLVVLLVRARACEEYVQARCPVNDFPVNELATVITVQALDLVRDGFYRRV